MKRMFKSGRVWLAALAVLLVTCVSVGSALAYFTTYSSASGDAELKLTYKTTITEEVGDDTKNITITNTGDVDVYVRARAFSATSELAYTGTNWELGSDGWYYYSEILAPGEDTEELVIDLNVEWHDETLEDFNVVVVQECAPVYYVDGVATADWGDE